MKKQFEIIENFKENFIENMLIFYRGPFNNKILAGIGLYIKEILKHDPEISFKIFSIFIELAQNIYYHSAELPATSKAKNSKFGILIMDESENSYEISAGNFIKNESLELIEKQCEKINSLEIEGLRQFKKEQRKLDRSQHGGANIGLIQVALTSANPIMLETNAYNDELSFMAISTTINK